MERREGGSSETEGVATVVETSTAAAKGATDVEREKNRKRALYSTLVAGLGFVCFAAGATAVGLPLWGYFDNPEVSTASERGYFGPWKVCKALIYGRENCGRGVARFKPVVAVWIAGLLAAGGVAALGIFCVMSVLQLAMVMSKDRVVLPYRTVLISKMALALIATLLAMVAAGLFALQTDDPKQSVVVTRGVSFYIQLVTIVLDFALFVLGLYDFLFSRQPGGDPTGYHEDDEATAGGRGGSRRRGDHAPSFNNPGYREAGGGRRSGSRRNGSIRRNGVAVTDASGKPYVKSHRSEPNGVRYEYYDTRSSIAGNGSVPSVLSFASDSTTVTTVSSVTGAPVRGPLRSSLKKPKPQQPPSTPDESVDSSSPSAFGIQNPGFSGTSPTLSRNGSVKKVRIQTHSTAV
ncbi:uncharacterized protein LOC124162927 [Ischnura elegans]|uniref:uncharacterized protein LOC124162927 n=1 Tax=Ischnura elegans TaxID=197161 RepID=UPI001ED8A06A|nr:uncharacterized protein LOC124162927 [Ischnura elegans]